MTGLEPVMFCTTQAQRRHPIQIKRKELSELAERRVGYLTTLFIRFTEHDY